MAAIPKVIAATMTDGDLDVSESPAAGKAWRFKSITSYGNKGINVVLQPNGASTPATGQVTLGAFPTTGQTQDEHTTPFSVTADDTLLLQESLASGENASIMLIGIEIDV